MDDLISRQAAIDAVEESRRLNHHRDGKAACAHEYEHRHFLKILMELPSAQSEPAGVARDIATIIENEKDMRVMLNQPRWIPVTERLPEEDYMTGKGVQYSASVLVTIVNHGNDDERSVDVACTADGVWRLTYPTDSPCIPRWCEVLAWMPLPYAYQGGENGKST